MPDSMSALYRAVKPLPFDQHGWFEPEKERAISALCDMVRPRVVVELGSWAGKSAIWFARRVGPEGTVFCVDHWALGVRACDRPDVQERAPRIFHLFLSNMVHAGVSDRVVPVRMSTLEAASVLDVRADMIYVDADHSEDAVYRDVLTWLPHLSEGGVICGDDWDGLCAKGVRRGVMRAAEELGRRVCADGYVWWLEPDAPGARPEQF